MLDKVGGNTIPTTPLQSSRLFQKLFIFDVGQRIERQKCEKRFGIFSFMVKLCFSKSGKKFEGFLPRKIKSAIKYTFEEVISFSVADVCCCADVAIRIWCEWFVANALVLCSSTTWCCVRWYYCWWHVGLEGGTFRSVLNTKDIFSDFSVLMLQFANTKWKWTIWNSRWVLEENRRSILVSTAMASRQHLLLQLARHHMWRK